MRDIIFDDEEPSKINKELLNNQKKGTMITNSINSIGIDRATKIMNVLQAFLSGKQIEIYNDIEKEWVVDNSPHFNLTMDNYRIKPEPLYRPYTFEEAKSLINTVVIVKATGEYFTIQGVCKEYVMILNIKVGFSDLLQYYTNIINKPLGVKISEDRVKLKDGCAT